MLSSMSMKQRLKCLAEQFIVGIFLASVFLIIGSIAYQALSLEQIMVGGLGRTIIYIVKTVCSLYYIFALIVGIAVLLHVFKIRYLDYYEIVKEETYNNTRMCSRGLLPEGYFRQTVISFNPWSNQHFIVKKLTQKLTPNEDILLKEGKQELIVEEEQEFEYLGKQVKEKTSQLLMITNYKLNEFLDIKDYAAYEKMRKEDYERYKTAGLGMPGIALGLIFRNWHIEDTEKYKNTFELIRRGLDFGYSSDPSCFLQFSVDTKRKKIYVFDEFSACELDNEQLANAIRPRMPQYALVKCDSAEPKSIAELNKYKINAIPATKGPDSILHGIKWLQGYEIIVDPKCKGLIEELGLYRWKVDKYGNPLEIPEDKNNHRIDSLRYGSDDLYLAS